MVIFDTGVLSHISVGVHVRLYMYIIRQRCLDLPEEKLGVQTASYTD